jgi:(2Fe-2S) ferredoxin
MNKPAHHIFVCGSYRQGKAQGVCNKKGANNLLAFFEQEAADRGLEGVRVSSTGCLQICDEGPIVVVYPENVWYRKVDEPAAEAILDAIENNAIANEHIIA